MNSNQKIISIIKVVIALFFLFFLIFELQRSFTSFPRVVIYIVAGSTADKLSQGTSIYDVLGDWNTFAYFTTWTNILFTLTFLIASILEFKNIKVSKYWINAIWIYSVITFVVFWTTIAPYMPWGQNSYLDYTNIHEHFIVILGCGVFWWFNRASDLKIKKQMIVSLIFPIIYLIVAIIIFIVGRVGVYPFLNFEDYFSLGIGTVGSVFLCLLTILIILGVIILASCLLANPKLAIQKIKIKKH